MLGTIAVIACSLAQCLQTKCCIAPRHLSATMSVATVSEQISATAVEVVVNNPSSSSILVCALSTLLCIAVGIILWQQTKINELRAKTNQQISTPQPSIPQPQQTPFVPRERATGPKVDKLVQAPCTFTFVRDCTKPRFEHLKKGEDGDW